MLSQLLQTIGLCPECSNELVVEDKETTIENISIFTKCEECGSSWKFEVNISEL